MKIMQIIVYKNSSSDIFGIDKYEYKELKMNNIDINFISQKVQIKFSQYLSSYCDILSVPEQKFLKDMVRGILTSRSCILRQIAQNLKEKISLKKVCKRLITHLVKTNLNEQLTEMQIQKTCHGASRDTLFIVDPSDIIKPSAEKMEGLSKVRDGSTKKCGNGYETLNILSVDTINQELIINPVASELFSNEQEIDTAKTKLFDFFNSIIIAGNNKGVFVFDRAFDDKIIISFFRDNDTAFIVRSMATRDLYYQGQKMNFIGAAKKANLSHTFIIPKKSRKGKTKTKTVYAGIIDVQIPLSPHPRKKNPDLFPAKLLVARYEDGGYWYLLCSLPNHSDLSEKELIEFIFNAYKIRWKIEEVHRHIKKDFHWEEMRLGRYERLRLLNTILWLSVGFLYHLQSLKYHFMKAFHYYMLDQKAKINYLPDFLFYRITLAVSECFSYIDKYKKIYYKKCKSDKEHPLLPFFENFLGVC
jgi:hypothetical protein